MQYRAIGLLGALAVALAGCVSTSVTHLDSGVRLAPTTPDAVVLYRSASQVPGPYREIALLDSSGDVDLTSPAQMYKSMREQAAKIGANGVILGEVINPSSGAQVASWVFGTPADRRTQAVAIFVTAPSAAATN